MTNIEFIDMISNYIRPIAKEKGYPFISSIVAQACLESNFGRSTLSKSYYNFFGMKCGSAWKGKSVNLRTREEYIKGSVTQVRDNFRIYDSVEEGIKGYFSFISTRRYSNLKNATSPYEYFDLLKADGWATDSAYVSKLNSIYETFHLYELDGEKEEKYQKRRGVCRTKKNNLNIRRTPNGRIIGKLPPGAHAVILEYYTGFYKIRYNGIIGYVCDDYFEEI